MEKKFIKTYPSIYLKLEDKLAEIARLNAELNGEENTESEE